jgi:ribonuclease BN (tRNA processing enzyme)
MELTILGSGTSIPSLRRAPPGYLLRAGSTLALLDSGPGTLRRVLEAGASLEEITHVFYSHTHVDHIADLAPLLFASRNPYAPRRSPLTIAGSRGFLEFFEGLAAIYGRWLEAETFDLTLAEVGERPGRVVLTHFYPSCEKADMLAQIGRTWDGEAVMAEDLMRIAV